MRRRINSILTLLLALIMLCSALPALAAVFHSDVRVKLSIGKTQTLSFTPVGSFSLKEASGASVGTDELTVQAVGGRVSITLDGKTTTAASLTLESKDYGGLSDYIRLENDEYGVCTYLGNMTFDVSEGRLRAINTLPIERYLYGVVPHEMSNSFPLEALKAQAVCARGYAVANCAKYGSSRSYDLVDTSKDQVYRGYASKNTRAIAAVDETAGQVLTYDGSIIEAYYSASNGGQTEKTGNVWENDLPYYVLADDPFDLLNASSLEETSFIPDEFTDATLPLMDATVLTALKKAAFEAAGKEVELVSTVSVAPSDPANEEPNRCYTTATVTLVARSLEGGSQSEGQLTVKLPLDELEFGSFNNTLGRIGAKKTRLRMLGAERGECSSAGAQYSGWYLTARRYGHGVGLSQRGAQERARAGQKYDEIVAFYYADTTLNTVGSYDTAPKLSSDSYKVRSLGISEISPGTTAEKLLKALSSKGELSVVDDDGKAKTSELATGDFVRTTYSDGAAFFDLPIIIFGDLDGDGSIDADDVATLQKHLLRQSILSGAYLAAADIDHDGDADISDLLMLIQYTQGDAKISQKG